MGMAQVVTRQKTDRLERARQQDWRCDNERLISQLMITLIEVLIMIL
jgi:hypothetical protein